MNNNPWSVFPEQFITRLQSIINQNQMQSVLESLCVRRPPTFRANTLKISADELEKKLTHDGFHLQKVPWYKDAFILIDQPQKLLMETGYYKNGFLYIQSLSSMIPPLVLDPKEDETVCDITAAPGSKTTQIAAIMKNSGKIIANDRSKIRLYKLEANLALQGVQNTEVTYLAAQAFWKLYPEYFDKMLVDVPCSMEGRFYCEYPKSYNDWSVKKIKDLAEIQKWILRSAVSATKSGGTIIYSTCTLSPEENEGVIDWILKKEKDALEVEEVSLPVENHMSGLTSWNNKQFNLQVAQTLRILPSPFMEGFYVAKLKKLKTTVKSTYQD